MQCGDSPIDLVYCWCDLADPVFRAKKEACARALGIAFDGEANSDCRYASNDELRYSLRSVEKFAPWVRRVFIVLNDESSPPQWLDCSCSRLSIVRLSDFIPHDCLPTFNSVTIEFSIPRIREISERFLYANDDMFFASRVSQDFFFAKDGFPVFRYMDSRIDVDDCKSTSCYLQQLVTAYKFIRDELGKCGDFAQAYGRLPHHNVDAYLKSDMLAFIERFPDAVSRTIRQQFRDPSQLQREAFASYALAVGHGHFRRTMRPWYETMFGRPHRDSFYFSPGRKSLTRDFARIRPRLFCMNDNDAVTDEDRKSGRAFLEKMFPEPSSFERVGM